MTTMNTNKVLIWLKDFKYIWLSQNILNDTHLIDLISNKLTELERLLTQDHQHENEITIISDDEYAETNNPESVVPTIEQRATSDIPNSIEKATDTTEKFPRPAIRLKRIPISEAEQYLPAEYQIPKSKRGRKSKRKTLSIINSHQKKTKKNISTVSTQDETATKSNTVRRSTRSKKLLQPSLSPSVPNVSSKINGKKKTKRKLHTMLTGEDDLYNIGNLSQTENSNPQDDCEQVSRYLGQNGILSQTRKTNDTTTYNDDFTFELHSRRVNQDKNRSTNESTTIEPVTNLEDTVQNEEEEIIENIFANQDNESLFATLEIENERSLDPDHLSKNNSSILNYNDCIEDISTDGIDPPPSSSSPNTNQLPLTT